jgi:hypothetical protein
MDLPLGFERWCTNLMRKSRQLVFASIENIQVILFLNYNKKKLIERNGLNAKILQKYSIFIMIA